MAQDERNGNGFARKRGARPLADLVAPTFAETMKKRGIPLPALVTHWEDIVGAEIGSRCAPIEIKWFKGPENLAQEPATLVLRVEGLWALEIQYQAPTIIERVNALLGWKAIGRIAIRQAPLTRTAKPSPPTPLSTEAIAAARAKLPPMENTELAEALARLSAALSTKR